ncbi:RNB domain-containing ribonuclease, partial [bacterium]|nr:RNB domain-containing ribonuclease [bacterium]
MSDLVTRIVHAVTRPSYTPVKAKVLATRMNVSDAEYPEFRKALKALVRDGRLAVGKNQTLRAADPHGTVVGVYRRTKSGAGYVRPHAVDGTAGPDVFIREDKAADASTGDEVLVRVTRLAGKLRDAAGEIVSVLKRATRTFVGTYFERDGEGFVRVDGTVFAHSVSVGDPGAKGVKPQDKVVIDLLRFPTSDDRGEGVITEVLGPHGTPGVDTLSVIKGLGLPEEFPPEALAEARQAAAAFSETDLHGRTDFTTDLVVTIDPADARDFDDAVSVTIDPKTKHWVLTVHIADVGHFAKPGGPLDAEARRRATSVYLPQKVIPMFPEVISNGLASLQEGKVRYVKTVRMEFTPGLQKGHVSFYNAAIRVRKRFTYEQVQAVFDDLPGSSARNLSPEGTAVNNPGRKPRAGDADREYQRPSDHADAAQGSHPGLLAAAPSGLGTPELEPDIAAMLKRMRDLALLLRKKRFKRGALELTMPEAVLEYDADGRMTGAHFAKHDLSHQVIEEFMLAANEAVAEHLTGERVPFLRRVHPAPKDEKLEAFAQFAGILGYPIKRPKDRGELQRVLAATADKPERAAVHFALLRSLKQAAYSPIQDEHYALASTHYCHFTSPIRRYPDLVVHRLLDRWITTGRAAADLTELTALGDHCSRMERRAETAERELVKVRILTFLSRRLGERFDAVITGVADYGFFAQVEQFPAEGLVHISSLVDDYYHFDDAGHALEGGRTRKRFRLGDRVRVEVARVDLPKRMLDFRLVPPDGKTRHTPLPHHH